MKINLKKLLLFVCLLKNYSQSHKLLTKTIEILSTLHHQDTSIGQLIKYLHYDRLLVDLYEALLRQTYLDNENNLWEKCQNFLKENHSDNGKYSAFKKEKSIFDEFELNSMKESSFDIMPFLSFWIQYH